MINHKSWDHLVKPYKVAFEEEGSSHRVGTVVVEPLEKGFGTTLGNALRRVLLSSLEGSAVTSIRIAGTLLEFSTVPGVTEDVTDIILNIKALDLNLKTGEAAQKFSISEKGPCVVTAGMIQGGSQLEILNPSQYICTLSEGATLSMDLYVSRGKGYVPAFSSVYGNRQLGEVAVDALFNPVKKVAYKVENARIAQSTDYDRLILTVETNGSISPKDAVSSAALILQDQLKQFVSFDPYVVNHAPKVVESRDSQLAFPPILFKNVKDLELNVRCLNCLQNEGIVYVGDLVKKKDIDLLKTPNFGRKSLNDINEVLGRMGLSLGMEFPDWPPENIEKHLEKQEDFERD